jgi:hypothetical protein
MLYPAFVGFLFLYTYIFMAKDPAILWYWNDWQGGTIAFSRHLKGCYMDLLHAQFNIGRLSLSEIKIVLGVDFSQWEILKKKFMQDENGNFYNERIEVEKTKRENFSKKQSLNGFKGGRPKKEPNKNPTLTPNKSLLENENENYGLVSLITIGGETFQKKCSEILNEEYISTLEVHLMGMLKGIDREKLLSEMDLEYPNYTFKDANHFANALKSVGKKILFKNESTGKNKSTPTQSISKF